MLSPDGCAIGYTACDSSESWQEADVRVSSRAIPDGKLLFSIPAYSERWHGPDIVAVSDCGAVLISLYGPGEGHDFRMVLFSSSGEVIWAGPVRSGLDEGTLISSDGTRIAYEDGMLINILTFSSDPTRQR
jgi:hypothetical protein